MSNLRDFTPNNSDSPRFIDEPLTLNEPVREAVFVDDGGLGDMHIRSDVEEEGTGRNKLFAGLAVAVMVGLGGAYAFTTMNNAPANVVADSKPAAKIAAMTPPPAPAAPAEATTPASAPEVTAPVVTKQAAVTATPKSTPMQKSMSSGTSTAAITPAPAPVEQAPAPAQAASNVPEPVSPTAPANSVAGNPALNQQSADPVAPAPVDAAPAPQATAPAPVDATPAPAAEAAPAPTPAQ